MGAVRSIEAIRFPTVRAHPRAATEALASGARRRRLRLTDLEINGATRRDRLRALAVYPGRRARATHVTPRNSVLQRFSRAKVDAIYRTAHSDNAVQDRYS